MDVVELLILIGGLVMVLLICLMAASCGVVWIVYKIVDALHPEVMSVGPSVQSVR